LALLLTSLVSAIVQTSRPLASILGEKRLNYRLGSSFQS
jgi:hypothetical protein